MDRTFAFGEKKTAEYMLRVTRGQGEAEAEDGGKRRCTGSNLAIAEITVLAARMIQDYEISLADPMAEWRPRQRLMLKADPFPEIKLVRRTWA